MDAVIPGILSSRWIALLGAQREEVTFQTKANNEKPTMRYFSLIAAQLILQIASVSSAIVLEKMTIKQ